MIAKSLSSWSELGALSHSARLASGNSFPMTGVTSKDLNWFRMPVNFSGELFDDLKSVGGSFMEPVGPFSSTTTLAGDFLVWADVCEFKVTLSA